MITSLLLIWKSRKYGADHCSALPCSFLWSVPVARLIDLELIHSLRLPQNRYFPLLCYPVIIYGKHAALSVAFDYVEVDALLRKPTTRQIGRHQYVTIYLRSIAQAC